MDPVSALPSKVCHGRWVSTAIPKEDAYDRNLEGECPLQESHARAPSANLKFETILCD